MGGCLGLKISETLTKHLCIMINVKNDKKTRANNMDDVKAKGGGATLTTTKCFSQIRFISALDIISTISTFQLLMNSILIFAKYD